MRLHSLGILLLLVATGCNVLGSGSSLDQTFRPGLPAGPFSNNWNFATASQYTTSSSTIDFTNGHAELTPASQTDSSATTAFAGGSSTGAAWDETNQYVKLDHTGLATDLGLDSSWTPAWSSLAAYWKLNETTGTTASDQLGLNDGIYSGTYTLGQAGPIATSPDYSAYFGTNSQVQVNSPTAALLSAGALTVEGWIKPVNPSGSGALGIIRCGVSNDERYMVFIWNNGEIGFEQYTGSSWLDEEVGGLILGAWNHFALVRQSDGQTISVYINGVPVLINYAMGGTPTTSGSPVCSIGQGGGTGQQYVGNIGELAVWNTALTGSAIATIYQHQSAKYAGTFTSRVIDGLAPAQSWSPFAWTPTLPFFKELPDGGLSESQTNYSSLYSSSLMSQIAGLWHFDETAAGSGGSGNDFRDASGNNNWGTITGGVTPGVVGKLGGAVQLDGSSGWVNIPYSSSLNLTSAWTISAWVNVTAHAANTAIVTQWYSGSGTLPFTIGWDNGGAGANIFAGVYSGGWIAAEAPTDLPFGSWQFVTGVYNGASNTVTLYINGKSVASNPGAPSSVASNTNSIFVGRRWDVENFMTGEVDELAIWGRALQPSEVLQLYRRGANRIRYQVQTCSSASNCTSSPNWMGPDGTNQTYFSELNNNLVQNDGGDLTSSDSVLAGLPSMTLSIPSNEYFQYRAIMESDDSGNGCNYGSGVTWCSPELQKVTVGPAHYDSTQPSIVNKTGISYLTLTNLIETLDPSGCTSGTLYNLSPDNSNWYYWTGAAWGLANGTATNANPALTVTSNLSTFASQVGTGSIYFKVFLQSSGTSPCAIDNLEIDGTH